MLIDESFPSQETTSPRPRQKLQEMHLDNVHIVSVFVVYSRASKGQLGSSWPHIDPQDASMCVAIYSLSHEECL